MLNFIYYPISWVLWFWHKAWGLILDPDSGITWALSIIFLVVTLRLLLLKPMIKQLRSGRKMQEMQPRMQEIKRKYAKDQQQQALEMRKLQKEMGVNPLASCLPMLVQIPIFLGLFHVLRSFNRTGDGMGQLGMTIEETRNTANYGFGVDEVQSFLDARLFGAPLSSYISIPEDTLGAFTDDGSVDFTRLNIALVVIPMMLVAAVIMHFNAKHSLARQARKKAEQAKTKKKGGTTPQQDMMENQMAMMQKLMVWVMPVLSLVGAYFWHVGLAVYMLTNTSWTFVQQILVYRKMDREEAEEKEAKLAAKRTNAPKPGKKPKDHGQAQATSTTVLEHTEDEKDATDAIAANPANPFTGSEPQESPAGPPLTEEQVKTYRSEAAAMSSERLDSTIAEIETQLKDPATKKRAKKQKRLAVLRQYRDEQR